MPKVRIVVEEEQEEVVGEVSIPGKLRKKLKPALAKLAAKDKQVVANWLKVQGEYEDQLEMLEPFLDQLKELKPLVVDILKVPDEQPAKIGDIIVKYSMSERHSPRYKELFQVALTMVSQEQAANLAELQEQKTTVSQTHKLSLEGLTTEGKLWNAIKGMGKDVIAKIVGGFKKILTRFRSKQKSVAGRIRDLQQVVATESTETIADKVLSGGDAREAILGSDEE